MLEVDDLHTWYGGIAALRGVGFRVARGSVVALVGANGAGKSTTLNTVSGLLAPRRGTIRFEGRDIAGLRMPRTGPPFMTDGQISVIRRWIAVGAPRD